MNKQFHLFFFLLLVVLSCNRCKEECNDPTNPDCPNYDPCLAALLPEIDFSISAGGYEAMNHDTLWCLSTITLSVTGECDSVHWLIGSDPQVHSGSSFDIYFGTPYQNVQLKAYIYRTPDFQCTGQSLAIDTVTKTISAVHWPDLPIWGWVFQGTFEDDPGNQRVISFHIEVDPDSPPQLPYGERFVIGLNESCNNDPCEGILLGPSNHRKVNLDVACCSPGIAEGSGYVSKDKSTVYFHYYTALGWRTFHGNRIN